MMLNKLQTLYAKLLKFDAVILCCLLLLFCINLIIQFSANGDAFKHLFSDLLYLLISFVVLFVFANINIGQLKHIAVIYYVISIILLIAVLLVGVRLHGAQRWINLGIRVQPSELCKLSVPLLLAYYFSLKTAPFKLRYYLLGAVFILIPFVLIAKQPDLGTALLVMSAGFFVLFFAGIPWKILIIFFSVILCSAPIIWHNLHEYQQSRILTLLNPQSDPLGKGYHIIQGIIAIGSGGFSGKGYLHGTQIHLNFIPEKHTDFVIAVLAEEFGYLGVCVVLSLYAILIFRCLVIVKHTNDLFSRLLASSLTLSFMLYVLINMGMVSGIFPVVGVPLPFISYGGSATIVLMIGFGIILSIARQNKY